MSAVREHELGETSRFAFEEPIDADTEARLRVEWKAGLEQVGIPPEGVGEIVADAVRARRFWVFPHPR